MKYKFLLGALLLGGAFSASADGYTDGIDYYNAGQYANARTVLNKTLNDASTNKSLAYYYLGQIEVLYKNYNEAKALFEKGIAADAQNPYNYVGMGAYYLRKGDPKEAANQFNQAQKLAKKNNNVTVEIARAYYYNDPESAENMKIVRKYIDKARKDSKNAEPSIYILEGDIIFNQGNPDLLGDAAAQYEMAISYDADNPEGYVKHSKAYMGVNPQFGIDKLKEFVQKNPNSALAQRELAERYYEVGNWKNAAEQYGVYINHPNHFPEDKARYSFLLWVYQDYDKANQICDEILATEPNNFQALRIKMLSQYGKKDNAAAEQTAKKFFALPANGNNAYTITDYSTYAAILQALDKNAEAVTEYEKAVALDPNKVETLNGLALAYSAADFNQKAAETMQKAIELTENPSLTQYLRASGLWLYAASVAEDEALKADNAKKGIECIDKVIAGVETPTPDYLRRRAQLLYTRDNNQVTPEVGQAYEALTIALDADPANMDPANNRLSWYEQCYKILNKYYGDQGLTDKQNEVIEKYTNVETLLGK